MKVEVSQVVDRPVATVFRFYAVDHVRNHPRWDPLMELEQMTDGPIGVGTVIRRRHTHFGDPVEGTMEVTKFEPDRIMAVVIREGDTETIGRMRAEPEGLDRTRIFLGADMPWIEESADPSEIEAMIQNSADTIKRLIESET